MDRLQEEPQRALFADTWSHPVEFAVELALIGRSYERYVDHTVELGCRLAYLTGGRHGTSYVDVEVTVWSRNARISRATRRFWTPMCPLRGWIRTVPWGRSAAVCSSSSRP